MGGYDAYCALCGARTPSDYIPDDDSVGDYYDPKIISSKDIEWMDDVRIICFNPDSPSRDKVYVTGKADYDDYGFFEAEPGDDPNIPTPDQADYLNGKLNIRVYDQGEGGPISYPFHQACYCLFGLVAAFTDPSGSAAKAGVDHELLYQSFKALDAGKYQMCLYLDWGILNDKHEQYSTASRGKELIGFDPYNTPGLQHHLYQSLPHKSADEIKSSSSEQSLRGYDLSSSSQSAEGFGNLPPETLLKIIAYLDINSMNSFRLTSTAIARVELSNTFWRQRVLRDLPWLFDSEATPQQTRLNWKETYRLMREISRSDCPERNPQVANRRRVWETCEQIASVYWAKHAGRKSLGKTPKPTLAGKIETRSLPACADFGTRHTAKENVFELQAIAQWTDIGKYPLHIESLWNPKGHLASLSTEIQYEGSTTWRQDMINSSALPEGSERQTVTVPPAKWISSITVVIGKCGNCRAVVGLIFTLLPEGTLIVGSMTGEKRLLEVANGNVFVGFQGELAEDLVVRLGISEGKPAEAAPYLASFIAEPKAGNVALLKYLWANEIPPRQLVPTKPHFGYWAADANRSEMVTMDALVIGTTEEELKGVTGISADALSWGFVVHYSDRPSRKVGQRHHAMKHFAISGFEGERVVGMTASSGALLDDVCLMTNWGRQCVFGRAPCSTAIVLQSGSFETQQVPEAGHFFAGFFGSWMYRENAMICCAKLSCPMENKTGPAPEPRSWTLDEGGRFLDTHLVPSHWKPSGPMYGNNPENTLADTGGNNKMPTDAGIASILDCSKPIDNIEVWFTHPQRLVIPLNQRRNNPNLTVAQCAEVQFVSIVLRLSNGSTVAVGPSEFDEMYKHPKVYEPLCNCAVYYEGHPLGPKKLEKKLPFKLHYHGEQWRIGGQKLAALRVWSSVFLDGLQFVACDGHVSPPFGLCEGDPSGVVQFGGWRAVGLKILSDTNSRPVTKQDVVLLGLQAMNLG